MDESRRYGLGLFVASLLGGLYSVGVDLDYFTPVGQVEPWTTIVFGIVGLPVCSLLYRLYEVVLVEGPAYPFASAYGPSAGPGCFG